MSTAEVNCQNLLGKQLVLEKQLGEASKIQPNADLVLTLQAAKAYLHNHPETDQCPVCSKPEPYASLVVQIDRQLTRLDIIQAIRDQMVQNEIGIQQANGAKKSAFQRWQTAITNLSQLLQNTTSILKKDLEESEITQDTEKFHPILHQIAKNRQALETEIQQGTRIISQHNALSTSPKHYR